MTNRSPVLSDRMEMLLRLAGSGECLCDVGCDHALVGATALIRGSFSRVISVDINEGPLLAAKKNRSEYGLDGVMELRQSDGLEALLPKEADTILIAGMGGATMQDILTRGSKTAQTADSLILSPQSEIGDFRRFLYDNGYAIDAEAIVLDDSKYYFAIRASFSGDAAYSFDSTLCPIGDAPYPFGDVGFAFGGRLLEEKNQILHDYLLRQYDKKAALLLRPGIAGGDAEENIKKSLELIEEALGIYEG